MIEDDSINVCNIFYIIILCNQCWPRTTKNTNRKIYVSTIIFYMKNGIIIK